MRLRTFVPGQDEEAFLAVNARAFAWHPEQGRLDLAGLRGEMAQEWFDPAGFFLAVTTGDGPEQVLGFHWTKVHPTDPNPGQPDPGHPDPGQPDPGPDPGQPDPGDGQQARSARSMCWVSTPRPGSGVLALRSPRSDSITFAVGALRP